MELGSPEWEDIKGTQLKVPPAQCNPSYAVACLKKKKKLIQFIHSTYSEHGRVSNAKQQNGRIC